MITLKINNTEVVTKEGTTLLEAAAAQGINIPALCYNNDAGHFTSCMLCLVKDTATHKFMPACTAKAEAGMHIITHDKELTELREMALGLLLSEHSGDCEAPCRIACPAFMNIPLMNRLIADGDTKAAYNLVREDIALPGVLGRICDAPCEKACKRKHIDQAVSVCLLKRFTYDGIHNQEPIQATPQAKNKVAIIGAGSAGLSAAYYLQLKGVQAVVFDKHKEAGGALRYHIANNRLDKKVLDREIEMIVSKGIEMKLNAKIDAQEFHNIRRQFDAVVVATGNFNEDISTWQLDNDGKRLLVDKSDYSTNLAKVFAIGNANRPGQQAIRSAAQGKEVAHIIAHLIKGEQVTKPKKRFNSRTGKMLDGEPKEYLKEGTAEVRQYPAGAGGGFTETQAVKEAARCLHCDCRKASHCKLRLYADMFTISKKSYSYSKRKAVTKDSTHDSIIYEEGKCIKCGICVRLTEKHKEKFGFTFIGRGFDVKLGVPFNDNNLQVIKDSARLIAEACPTGALANKKQLSNE